MLLDNLVKACTLRAVAYEAIAGNLADECTGGVLHGASLPY
jgi:hypothetical protein